jgi:hypothetical protein
MFIGPIPSLSVNLSSLKLRVKPDNGRAYTIYFCVICVFSFIAVLFLAWTMTLSDLRGGCGGRRSVTESFICLSLLWTNSSSLKFIQNKKYKLHNLKVHVPCVFRLHNLHLFLWYHLLGLNLRWIKCWRRWIHILLGWTRKLFKGLRHSLWGRLFMRCG